MGNMRNVHKIIVRKCERKRALGIGITEKTILT
jgi:hypothetical protein